MLADVIDKDPASCIHFSQEFAGSGPQLFRVAEERDPKPKGADRFPATDQGGPPSLADRSGPEIVLTCDTFGRREVFVVAELRLRLGSDMLMTNVRMALSADARSGSRHRSTINVERC